MITLRHCVVAAAVVTLLAGASYARGAPVAQGASYITAIQVDPKRPNVVYVSALGGSRGAVIKSTDGGRTWSSADTGLTMPPGYDIPRPGLRVDALAIDPRSPNVLYAGTALGVFKSSDGANAWKLASAGIAFGGDLEHRLIEGFVYAIAIDPLRTSTVYAAGGHHGGTNRHGLWKSTEGRASACSRARTVALRGAA